MGYSHYSSNIAYFRDRFTVAERTLMIFFVTASILTVVTVSLGQIISSFPYSTMAEISSSIILASAASASFYLAKERFSTNNNMQGMALAVENNDEFSAKIVNTGEVPIPIIKIDGAMMRYQDRTHEIYLYKMELDEAVVVEPKTTRKLRPMKGDPMFGIYNDLVNLDSEGQPKENLEFKNLPVYVGDDVEHDKAKEIFKWFIEELGGKDELKKRSHGRIMKANLNEDIDKMEREDATIREV